MPGAMITAMDVDKPQDVQRWDSRQRGETEIQRLDRNWNSLLRELRVVQTGVQLLTGFLLTLPFQQRFSDLSGPMRHVYLTTVGLSVSAVKRGSGLCAKPYRPTGSLISTTVPVPSVFRVPFTSNWPVA